jgi:hypothetical protein
MSQTQFLRWDVFVVTPDPRPAMSRRKQLPTTHRLAVGNVRKFLLKTAAQREQAGLSIAAYAQFHEQLEELSQINTELLRRGELLSESPS